MGGRFAFRFGLVIALALLLTAEAAPLKLVRGPYGSGRAHLISVFDGQPQLCVLDSGSLFSIAADPEAFGSYPAFGEIRFQSAAGVPMSGDKIRIGTIQLDKRVFRNVTVARIDPGEKVRSTIGLNLLALQPFSLLFRDEASLHLGRNAVRGEPQPLTVHESGMFTLPVKTPLSAELAVWDTGAELTAVDRRFVAARPEQFTAGRSIGNVVDGTDQAVAAQLWRMMELTIGRKTFRNVRVLAVDFSTIHKATRTNVHFVVGFNLIRNADWYIDVPGRRWTVR